MLPTEQVSAELIERNLIDDLNEQHSQRTQAVASGAESKALAAQMMFLHGSSAAEMATAYGYPQAAYVIHAKTVELTAALDPSFNTDQASAQLRPTNPTYRMH